MDERVILDHLETLAHKLGLQIRYERLDGESGFSAGGLCRVKDRQFIFVNSHAPDKERIRILARVLKRFDLSSVYLKPALRELLEKPDQQD